MRHQTHRTSKKHLSDPETLHRRQDKELIENGFSPFHRKQSNNTIIGKCN